MFTGYCDCPAGYTAAREDHPYQYPPCSSDPPFPPEESCGYENCDLHNILWLEKDGCNHAQAIGITAAYNFSENWGYGPVADALGGMDEFHTINENGPDVSQLIKWYEDHQPLIYYIMETSQRTRLWDFWLQATNPTWVIPERGRLSIHLVKDDQGQWQPYHVPGQPAVIPEDYQGWSENYDVTKASLPAGADHIVAHFEYKRNPSTGQIVR